MRLRLRRELAFHHDIAARPCRCIAVGQRCARADVRGAARIEYLEIRTELFVDDRSVGRQRSFRRQDRRQLLVFDVDETSGQLSGGLGLGGDGGDRLADIAHLAFRDRVLVLDEGTHAVVAAEVVAGQHRLHARHRERLADIVGFDARMCVRAAEDRAVQHARAVEIGDVLRAPLHLLAHFGARKRRSDGFRNRAHGFASRAAAATASTILR